MTSKLLMLAVVLLMGKVPSLAQTEGRSIPAQKEVKEVQTKAGPLVVEELTKGLRHPWGMAFLPSGDLLVTERPGRLNILRTNGELSGPVKGTPGVFAKGQGGLLDVALDPDFQKNSLVYLTFSEPGEGGASTAVRRGKFQEGELRGFEVIFRQEPKVEGPNHFGSRLVFTRDGDLFVTLGERFKFAPAQDLSNHLGTVVRIRPDGSVPGGNPFKNQENARPEIWSYGHRNIQSAALHPETGQLWIAEMGPKGGDELNLPEAGKNYGWPEVSWGRHYNGESIPDPPTSPKFADAIRHWTPVISPSGMTFYTADQIPEWKGSVLIGGLSAQCLVRLEHEGSSVKGEERIPLGARIRDVEQGPEGFVYVLTDRRNGSVWRLRPRE